MQQAVDMSLIKAV